MNRHAATVALLYITGLLAVAALAGCERQAQAPNAQAVSSAPLSAVKEPAADSRSARTAAAEADDWAAKDTIHISASMEPSTSSSGVLQRSASPAASKPVGKSETQQQPVAPKPKVDAKDAYKEEKPTLLGLSLRASRDDVLAKLGNAQNKFTMDDDIDPITVYEYADFSVGFNKDNKLEFVDVQSADIDPGLHGLHIGQKVEDAVNALGKPDSSSSYVLTYKSQGTVLKLDLEAKSGTIRSIKLFAFK